MSRSERQLNDYELARPAESLAKRFVQRWDLHARQLNDGRYICIHKQLNVDHLFGHLRGEITLGTYLLNQNSQASFVVFDADDIHGFERLARLSNVLANEDVPSYLERSRRGGHLWLFLAQAVPGRYARAFGLGLLAAHNVDNVEMFPKQDELVGGPGGLIRMPFGIHRLTGCCYGFFNPDGFTLAPTIIDQIHFFQDPQVVPDAAFEAYRSYVLSKTQFSRLERSHEPGDTISERIKKSETVLEFVSRYVELKPIGNGALGLCPFHDDHRPSFGINDKGNYWHCFAGCGGGSVIDFWIKWRNCNYFEAITELTHMLL